jgi:hypothetical protein
MDFKPAQGGGVAGEGSGSELGRGDGQLSVGKRLVSGLDTGVGNLLQKYLQAAGVSIS